VTAAAWRLIGGAVLVLLLVGVGWIARTCTLAPPPDVAALLHERDSVLGVEHARQDSLRRANAQVIDSAAVLAHALDSMHTDARKVVQRLAAQVTVAQHQTDSVIATLDTTVRETVALALELERSAQHQKDLADAVADSIAADRLATELGITRTLREQRERDSLRIVGLEGTVARLGQGLERTRPKGLQPAGSVTYGPLAGDPHWVIGGTIRVPGTSWLRVGLHWVP